MEEIDQKVAWQALCHLFCVRLDIILVVVTNPLLCPLPLCVRLVVTTTPVCSPRYLHSTLSLCMSFVCLSIPLYYVLLPCFPCSLHTNNSATTQLNRKLLLLLLRLECLAAKGMTPVSFFEIFNYKRKCLNSRKSRLLPPRKKKLFLGET